MKFLILLLLPLTAYSLTISERINALSPRGDIRMHMHKCGYNIPNMALFKKALIKKNDTVKMDCLELKDIGVKKDRKDQSDYLGEIRKARERMKDAGCLVLESPFNDMCILLKGR